MKINKSVLATCLLLAGLAGQAQADQYRIGEDKPLVASGTALLVEDTQSIWVQMSPEQFQAAKGLTSSNNYRSEHNTLLINAFGVNSESFRYSKNNENRLLWADANTLAQYILNNKQIDLYCTETTSIGMLSCIIFARHVDADGKETIVNYNQEIFEAGLSRYNVGNLIEENDKEEAQLSKMQKIIIYSQAQAKKIKAGLWSRNTGILDIEFEQ
ncbi:hypothetical protein LMH73_021560 [Vibrio splendidus]|nr:hypothetical protein [Vibrio splendidus]MCC4881489.1 hypothetical protein [Vibrio splendidus]